MAASRRLWYVTPRRWDTAAASAAKIPLATATKTSVARSDSSAARLDQSQAAIATSGALMHNARTTRPRLRK